MSLTCKFASVFVGGLYRVYSCCKSVINLLCGLAFYLKNVRLVAARRVKCNFAIRSSLAWRVFNFGGDFDARFGFGEQYGFGNEAVVLVGDVYGIVSRLEVFLRKSLALVAPCDNVRFGST